MTVFMTQNLYFELKKKKLGSISVGMSVLRMVGNGAVLIQTDFEIPFTIRRLV
jgi:hypothetical protein